MVLRELSLHAYKDNVDMLSPKLGIIRYKPKNPVYRCTRIPGHKAIVENARLASKGLSIKGYKNIDLPGRICLDVLEAIRKEIDVVYPPER